MREMDAEAYHFRHSEGYASTPWNPPIRGRAVRHRGRGRVVVSTVILAKRGSPKEGHGSTLSLPSATIGGIPARSARMTAEFESRHRYHGRTIWGIASSQSPLGSASALRRKLLSLPCSSFSAAIRFAGFASEAGESSRG